MQALVTLKFQHCDFSAEFAQAMAAYDADPKTAWIRPFTLTQKDYWATQTVGWLPVALINAGATLAGSHLFNKLADDLATQRNTAINNAAYRAFNNCIAGGATTAPAPVTEPGFRVSIQTRLDGGTASSATPSDSGLSTQLQVPFAPANPALADFPLDWRPFYRLGAVITAANDPQNWTMAYTGSDLYTAPVYLTTPMRTTIKVTPGWLAAISGLFEQCIPYPTDRVVTTPDSLDASFETVRSELTFTVFRHVLMPDGALTSDALDVNLAESDAWNSGQDFELSFPGFSSDCEQSGTVIVRHQIQVFALYSEFALNSDIEKLRDDVGVVHDRPAFVASQGSLTQMVGNFPDAYLYLEESFNYRVFKLGIVRVKYYDGGSFQYQKLFLVWAGMPVGQELLVGLSSNATPTKFYGKHLSQTTATFESVHIYPVSAGSTIDTTINVPVIEEVEVNNISSGILTVSSSAYIAYADAVIKVHNVLKPLDVFTPDGAFVTPQPGYQSTGHFLSVLPDFVDYMNWADALGIVRVKYYETTGTLYKVRIFLDWKSEPKALIGDRIVLATSMTLSELSSASVVSLRLYESPTDYSGQLGSVSIIEEATCTKRDRTLTVTVYDFSSFYFLRDPANPDTSILQWPYDELNYPGYPRLTLPYFGYYHPVSRSVALTDFIITSTGFHCSPYTLSSEGNNFTIVNITGVISPRNIAAGAEHVHFYDTSLTNSASFTNTSAYEFLGTVDDCIQIPTPYESLPAETWPSLV